MGPGLDFAVDGKTYTNNKKKFRISWNRQVKHVNSLNMEITPRWFDNKGNGVNFSGSVHGLFYTISGV